MLLYGLICLGIYVVLIVFLWMGWIITPTFNEKSTKWPESQALQVSVLIPFRNEAENLRSLIKALRRQETKGLEVEYIFINDHSTDDFENIFSSENLSRSKLISLPESRTGKKAALTFGVNEAQGELILTTDADCKMNENWVRIIAGYYALKKPRMIVAPVLAVQTTGFLSAFQSMELAVLTACAAGALKWRIPLLSSGANLAFEKEAFKQVGGYEGTDSPSGDDVFLMMKMNKKFPGKIDYLKAEAAVVSTRVEKTFSSVFTQKKRWAGKTFLPGLRYIGLIAFLIYMANFTLILMSIFAIFEPDYLLVFVFCFSIKSLIDLLLLLTVTSYFKQRINPLLFILSSVVYPPYTVLIGALAPITNYTWKLRRR